MNYFALSHMFSCLIITIESLYLPRPCVYTSVCMHWIYSWGFHILTFCIIWAYLFENIQNEKIIALCNMLIFIIIWKVSPLYTEDLCVYLCVYTLNLFCGIKSCIDFLTFQSSFLEFFFGLHIDRETKSLFSTDFWPLSQIFQVYFWN